LLEYLFSALFTCGAFTPDGEFLELPELDLERLQTAWQEAVFAMYLAEDTGSTLDTGYGYGVNS
jgi:hypothetical protein